MGLMIAKLRKFGSDESGLAMILVSIMLPVIIGFALLVIDGSRAGNLHNDTQRGADALALAAAAELDGGSDAWIRAERALENLVDNTTRFSNGGTVVLATGGMGLVNGACNSSGNLSWCFLKDIPGSAGVAGDDSTPISPSNYAANAAETRFIQVIVTPQGFTTIFPASFIDGGNTMTIGSEAVAGFVSGVCDFTPVYICNPYEGTGLSLGQVISSPALRGRMIELRQQGGNSAQNSPGNYGFLVPSDGNSGANNIRDVIASVSSQSCFSNEGVEVRPGFLATVRDALNVRFDIYDGPMNSNRGSANFAPGRNVRKGYRPGNGNACNATEIAEPTTDFQRMSRDTCFYGATCDTLTGLNTGNRVGDGNWDFDTYWSENRFPISAKPLGRDGTNTASNSNPPSRYELYRWELTRNSSGVQVPEGSASSLIHQTSVGTENGVPACSSQTPPADVDRRIIFGAIINCQANPIGSGASGGLVPPEAFGSFFITETVESGPDQIIRVELVDITGRFGNGTLEDFVRDEAQLYR